jgi:hypothetical protein
VRRIEERHLWVNAVADALAALQRVLRQPGRYLDGPQGHSPGIEPEDQRDTLAAAMRLLPRGARTDLGRILDRLDHEYERRTLPAPGPASDWARGRGWWWRRMREL